MNCVIGEFIKICSNRASVIFRRKQNYAEIASKQMDFDVLSVHNLFRSR